MAIDPSAFNLGNVADSCSLWNLLSSQLFYGASIASNCSFCCTNFVLYECLYKQRSDQSKEDDEIKQRFSRQYEAKTILACDLDISDLQDVQVLEARKRLGKGELSSIVFAGKTRQAFLTDDQAARRLATEVLPAGMVQTIPHLFGWLFFHEKLTEVDKDSIISEHERLKRPLRKYFEEMYMEALRCRIYARKAT